MKKLNTRINTIALLFVLVLCFPLVVLSMDSTTPLEEQVKENYKTVITGDFILELSERIPVPKFTPYQSQGSVDTINLMATIVRHVDNEPRPTILVVTPYRRWVFILQGLFLFNHGYDVVAIDIRGTGSSESEFLFMAPEEHFDTAYIIDHWVPSQPWSNGKIGMIGHSYNGIIQLLASGQVQVDEETGEPVHLKALMPQHIMSSCYDESMHGGIPEFGFMSFWAGLHTWLNSMPPILYMGNVGSQLPTYTDFKDASEMWLNNILSTPIEFSQWWFNVDREIIDEWNYVRSPMLYWPEKPKGGWNLPGNLGDTTIPKKLPVLLVGGWHDIFSNGTFEYYQHGLSNHDNQDKALIVGPWYHANGVFDPYYFMIIAKIAPRWFDCKIKGIEDDFLSEYPILLYINGENKWRAEKSWPLQETRKEKKTYYLTKKYAKIDLSDWFSIQNCLNNFQLKETISNLDYIGFTPVLYHDPLLSHGIKSRSYIRWFPFGVPALPAHFSHFILGKNIDAIMPYEDERLDELGVLTFSTSKLEEDIEIVGPIKLTFWAKTEYPTPLLDSIKQSVVDVMNKFYIMDDSVLLLDTISRKDVQWMVEINDVFPSGRAKNITSGWLSAWHRPYDPNEDPESKDHIIDPNYVAFDPFYETPHKNPKPINEGEIYPYVVEIWPTDNIFKAGHKIRVSISASDIPHALPILRNIKNTIIIDDAHQAKLEFNVANKKDEGITWQWVDNIFDYITKPPQDIKTGSVSGTIKTNFAGQNDIKVANALISFENSNITTTTNSDGHFSMNNIPSGEYKMLITAPNLDPIAHMVNVPEADALTLNDIPPMKVESFTEKQYSEDELNQLIQQVITDQKEKWDINGDNKKGLEEAIDALQHVTNSK